MKKFALMTLLVVASLALPGIFCSSTNAQEFVDEYLPQTRNDVPPLIRVDRRSGGEATATDHNGEFWFENLHPGMRAIDAFLKIKDIDGESKAVEMLILVAALGDAEDPLIVNNGDGSDFMGKAAGVMGDLTAAGPPVQLIGLLLPAIQKVR